MNRGPRRALSNLGGPAERRGDPAVAEALAVALEQAVDPDEGRRHVHGFHSYPARLHPAFARRLIEALTPPGGAVLDPFCGSGTVLVEARIAGRAALGVDLNPLAVRLARLKAEGRPPEHMAALLGQAQTIAASADERRKRKAGASRRYPPADVAAFAPHVLLELDSLRAGVEAAPAPLGADLALVLSSILTKLSLRAGDSSEHQVPKRLAAGFAARLFVARTDELGRQMRDYLALVPPSAPAPRVLEGDSRSLPPLGRFDLVLTSPPYPGNYDYLAHHELRLRWLGLEARALAEGELGARRTLEAAGAEQARARWLGELTEALRGFAAQLAPSGKLVLLLADSVVAGRPFYNDDLVIEASRAAGFAPLAAASQPRPHFHGPSARAFAARPRREHAICLAQAGPSVASHRPDAPRPHRSQPARTRRRDR